MPKYDLHSCGLKHTHLKGFETTLPSQLLSVERAGGNGFVGEFGGGGEEFGGIVTTDGSVKTLLEERLVLHLHANGADEGRVSGVLMRGKFYTARETETEMTS